MRSQGRVRGAELDRTRLGLRDGWTKRENSMSRGVERKKGKEKGQNPG